LADPESNCGTVGPIANYNTHFISSPGSASIRDEIITNKVRLRVMFWKSTPTILSTALFMLLVSQASFATARGLDARLIAKVVDTVALEGERGSISGSLAHSLGLGDSDIPTVGKALIWDRDSEKSMCGLEVGTVKGRREVFVVLRKQSYIVAWRIRATGSIITVAEGEDGNFRPSPSQQESDLASTFKCISGQSP